MVPGEYSLLRMPTISPRAWAGDDIAIPAPMVTTAKAAAILNDIVLSIPVCPRCRGPFRRLTPEGGGLAGLTHAFLTASLNRTVSTPARDRVPMRGRKENFETK